VCNHNVREICDRPSNETDCRERYSLQEAMREKIRNKNNHTIKQIFNWEYPNKELTGIKGKASVTEIAQPIDENDNQYMNITKKPKFLQESIKLTRTEIGTITHLILQNLDFKLEYDKEKIKTLINNMVEKEILTKQEAKAVDENQILKFTRTKIYAKIQKAKKIFKEQPFYMNIPVKEIYNIDSEEKVLVQGIIDLYFIDEHDNIILVDYKTNYVEIGKEEELTKQYEKQLSLYKRAIEEVVGKKVEKTYIYSTYLGKEIQAL